MPSLLLILARFTADVASIGRILCGSLHLSVCTLHLDVE
jgi:hypothetical protein